MRLIVDTNIIIPLEQSQQILEPSLANFVRLAHENNHQLLYHPATIDDISRDKDESRKSQTLQRLKQYTLLESRPKCPWNKDEIDPNNIADNEILYAIYCDAAHALITEDRGVHKKAKEYGLSERVYYIQTAEDWLNRLHAKVPVQLPNIREVKLFEITNQLSTPFFDSLREAYSTFDSWFRDKARDGVEAWIVNDGENIGAICIFDIQIDEKVTKKGLVLNGSALKLCTFKVAETMRGRKIGELFLKAAFRYASNNFHANIFIHGDYEKHEFLFELLEDFGFQNVGTHPGDNDRDVVYVKEHPIEKPDENKLTSFEYAKKYFPHFLKNDSVKKYLVPIRPEYHKILFPEYSRQEELFSPQNYVGNCIKLAYLCHAQISKLRRGDIVLFYRSVDEMSITSIGIVESYEELGNAMTIAQRVSRRTVYNMEEIEKMAKKKPAKVMLFRLISHFSESISYDWLLHNKVIKGAVQTIREIDDESFMKVEQYGKK